MTSNFVAFNGIGRDPLADADKKLPVYNELVRGLKAENKAIKAVRLTEEQIREDLSVSLKNSKSFFFWIYSGLINYLYTRWNFYRDSNFQLRQSEDKNPKLEILIYDVFRNENAKKRREYLREQAELEKK